MNGDWYPWSESANGNSAGQYVAAWRHVHDIFTEVGATNVTWVWSPNTTYPGSIALSGLYPGDAYVDWVGIDAYNWGANPDRDGWQSFAQVVTPTYDELAAIAPSKPVMLPEVGSSELGGSKAAWITDALATIPIAFPRIRAVVWFNWDTDGMNWTIESSESARSAFAAGIASPVYAGSEFSALPSGPIPRAVAPPPIPGSGRSLVHRSEQARPFGGEAEREQVAVGAAADARESAVVPSACCTIRNLPGDRAREDAARAARAPQLTAQLLRGRRLRALGGRRAGAGGPDSGRRSCGAPNRSGERRCVLHT